MGKWFAVLSYGLSCHRKGLVFNYSVKSPRAELVQTEILYGGWHFLPVKRDNREKTSMCHTPCSHTPEQPSRYVAALSERS
jgi:hypothetical protein